MTIGRCDDIGTTIFVLGGNKVVRVRGLVGINDDRIRAAGRSRVYGERLRWAVELRLGGVESRGGGVYRLSGDRSHLLNSKWYGCGTGVFVSSVAIMGATELIGVHAQSRKKL